MRAFVVRLAAAGLAFGAFGAAAHAEAIACPLSDAMRTITTPLPAQWYTTPIVAALSGTRTDTVGGTDVLECLYGDAGIVTRAVPAGETCTTTPTGFDCRTRLVLVPLTPLIPLAPVTLSTGLITWQPSYQINLDDGSVGSAGVDLWYQAISATTAYVTPMNGARLAAATTSASGYAGCAAMAMSDSDMPLPALMVDHYFCARTSDNRISEFRVNASTGGGLPTLTIGYTTWQ